MAKRVTKKTATNTGPSFQIGVRISKQLLARVDEAAKRDSRTRSRMVELLIQRGLEA